jgi:pyridoxal phosphate enzyme (YggS family)
VDTIAQNLEAVQAIIAQTARAAGREPGGIELVAVSKTHPPESIQQVIDCGHLLFGESRVQEARAKIPVLPSKARWHFIGHLQKNKIRQALPLFELFHGVDSLALAGDMNRIAAELGLFPKILLEVNVAGEASKYGFPPEKLRNELEALLALDRLQIVGLMTIAPFAEEAEPSRKYFARLRELRDELQTGFRVQLPHLSMGMSGDYIVAIQEGATMVRIGTAIFGPRSAKALRASDALSQGE